MYLGELDEAEAGFHKVIELMKTKTIRPDFIGRVYSDYINFLYFKRQNRAAAIGVAEQMTQLLPDHPDGWGWLAYIQKSTELRRQYVIRLNNSRGNTQKKAPYNEQCPFTEFPQRGIKLGRSR